MYPLIYYLFDKNFWTLILSKTYKIFISKVLMINFVIFLSSFIIIIICSKAFFIPIYYIAMYITYNIYVGIEIISDNLMPLCISSELFI